MLEGEKLNLRLYKYKAQREQTIGNVWSDKTRFFAETTMQSTEQSVKLYSLYE